jgi:predicted  nucleic acid-binding Zn-ribbon protein
MDAVQKEMTDALTKASADHEVRMKQLHDQVDALERQLAEVVEKDRDDEIRMRKEKGRAESALNAKIAQYDEDMGARQKNLQELKELYSVEAKEYSVLKEYFDRIDSDLNRAAQEETILASVAKRRAFGVAVLHRAAATIQKIARGRIARAAVAKMKAKAKKGGKKKKKK